MGQEFLSFIYHVITQITGTPIAKDILSKEIEILVAKEDIRINHWKYYFQCIKNNINSLSWLKTRLEKNRLNLCEIAQELSHQLEKCKKYNIHYISQYNDNFPPLLKTIDYPPVAISIQGNITKTSVLTEPNIAIIGSRKSSIFALEQSFKLAKLLSQNQQTIISGGAYGCDIAAQKGVLNNTKNKIKTITVQAGGFCHLYPKGNNHIFQETQDRGGILITERLWFQKPKPWDFPIRNRIISGIAHTTIVMHAEKKSGALITAQMALDQGRDVIVLKQKKGSQGTEDLIEQGAQYFENYLEVENLLNL